MAKRELDNLVRCNVDARALEVEVEEEGWAIKITDGVRHEWSRVKAAVCSSALKRLCHKASALVCESAGARDGAASTFPSEATAPTRHRPLLPQTAGICGGIPPPTRPPEPLLWRHVLQTLCSKVRRKCEPLSGNAYTKRETT